MPAVSLDDESDLSTTAVHDNAEDIKSRHEPEVQQSSVPGKWIDEDHFHDHVLRIASETTEDDIDKTLAVSAKALGISPPQSPITIESITSSLSAITTSSEPNPPSLVSQSTAPTSCASSEYRPGTSLSNASTYTPGGSAVPSILSDIEKKRHSGFRNGFKKMTTFRKRRSLASASASVASIDSETTNGKTGDRNSMSIRSPVNSPSSLKSSNSFVSNVPSIPKTSFEPESSIDTEALQRSLNCSELLDLRTTQLEEKRRFLEYQMSLIGRVRSERDRIKADKAVVHKRKITEQEEKNEKSVEQLEARQLEEEVKLRKEHDVEKRAIMTRLRYMEAYCQNPSPPSSPVDDGSGRQSAESSIQLPERHITQQHYESLAQQYHKRDTMDSLHDSKINVLRGRQKRAVENLMRKKDREIEVMEQDQKKEFDAVDFDYGKQEADIRREFDLRRPRLEKRWKMQCLIEKAQMERKTGLKYEALPDLLAV